jgi:hypothetical protein
MVPKSAATPSMKKLSSSFDLFLAPCGRRQNAWGHAGELMAADVEIRTGITLSKEMWFGQVL